MATSVVRQFHDPWEQESFFRPGSMKLIVTAPGEYRGKFTRVTFDKLWMQRCEVSLPHIAHIAVDKSRSAIAFLTGPKQISMIENGREWLPGVLDVSASGSEDHFRSRSAIQWGAMSLTPSDLAEAGIAILGRELKAPRSTQMMRPPAHLMSRLQSLHAAVIDLSERTPTLLGFAEIAIAIEQELVLAMVHCLGARAPEAGDPRGHWRLPVIQRLERFLEAHPAKPLYVPEVCAGIGVSERTLRLHCLENLGMSPHRYLLLRRMNQVRRALAMADPSTSSVTTIASDHGFWEAGRFAVAYRRLFGETPSTTLRNPGKDLSRGRLPISL